MIDAVVRLRDARFGYGGKVAASAELEIGSGEVVAVLGPNGSGKSTLVKGMLGLVDCYRGHVDWYGERLGSRRERWRVGYVPQRELVAAPVPATLEEVVRSGRVSRIGVWGRIRAADRHAVGAALDTVGLGDRRGTPIRQLSGGQQRRGLVARALAGEGDALVLDEPFAGVDRDSQEGLAATFRGLVDRGMTLIIVVHELGPLEGVVTRTVCMGAGEVAYDGPPLAHPTAGHHDIDPHGGLAHDPAPGSRPSLGLLAR